MSSLFDDLTYVNSNEGQSIQPMLLSFVLFNCIFPILSQSFLDEAMFNIQNPDVFNPYMFGPPPIFHVKRNSTTN